MGISNGYAYQSRKHDADDTWNVKGLGYDTKMVVSSAVRGVRGLVRADCICEVG